MFLFTAVERLKVLGCWVGSIGIGDPPVMATSVEFRRNVFQLFSMHIGSIESGEQITSNFCRYLIFLFFKLEIQNLLPCSYLLILQNGLLEIQNLFQQQ